MNNPNQGVGEQGDGKALFFLEEVAAVPHRLSYQPADDQVVAIGFDEKNRYAVVAAMKAADIDDGAEVISSALKAKGVHEILVVGYGPQGVDHMEMVRGKLDSQGFHTWGVSVADGQMLTPYGSQGSLPLPSPLPQDVLDSYGRPAMSREELVNELRSDDSKRVAGLTSSQVVAHEERNTSQQQRFCKMVIRECGHGGEVDPQLIAATAHSLDDATVRDGVLLGLLHDRDLRVGMGRFAERAPVQHKDLAHACAAYSHFIGGYSTQAAVLLEANPGALETGLGSLTNRALSVGMDPAEGRQALEKVTPTVKASTLEEDRAHAAQRTARHQVAEMVDPGMSHHGPAFT